MVYQSPLKWGRIDHCLIPSAVQSWGYRHIWLQVIQAKLTVC